MIDTLNKIIVIITLLLGVTSILAMLYQSRISDLRMMGLSIRHAIQFSNFKQIINKVTIKTNIIKKTVYVEVYVDVSKSVMNTLIGSKSTLEELKQMLNYFIENQKFKYKVNFIEE